MRWDVGGILFSLFAVSLTPSMGFSRDFQMQGLVGYVAPALSQNPPRYDSTTSGIGYAFFGRLSLDTEKIPTYLESGFLFSSIGIKTNETFGSIKTSSSYWFFPLLFRIEIWEPFFSIGLGPDFSWTNSTEISLNDASLTSGISSRYRSHFGAQASIQLKQDIGENLSVVSDFRYRQGFGAAISFSNQASKLNFFTILIGIQKHLSP